MAGPLPSAIIAGIVTAATLSTLGAVSVYSMQRIMERDAARETIAAATAVALHMRPEAFAATHPRAAGDAAAPGPAADSALSVLIAALPDVADRKSVG